MDITAHGGALKTGRNTPKYFDTIKNYKVDIIEVDIYKCKDLLYISHLPSLFPKRRLPLSFVFEFIEKYDFRVNCDVKTRGLVRPVLELAEKMGVSHRIIFTGAVKDVDMEFLTAGEAYLNASYFGELKPYPENIAKIKQCIDSLGNERIKGLNLGYKFCSEKMLEEADRVGLKLSIYTVDDQEVLKRLCSHAEIDNITTNIPDVALRLRGE